MITNRTLVAALILSLDANLYRMLEPREPAPREPEPPSREPSTAELEVIAAAKAKRERRALRK